MTPIRNAFYAVVHVGSRDGAEAFYEKWIGKITAVAAEASAHFSKPPYMFIGCVHFDYLAQCIEEDILVAPQSWDSAEMDYVLLVAYREVERGLDDYATEKNLRIVKLNISKELLMEQYMNRNYSIVCPVESEAGGNEPEIGRQYTKEK